MMCRPADFYPRSPCGERRASPFSIFWICHFYPRSPCGERPLRYWSRAKDTTISIHALLAESDGGQHDRKRGYTIFLSTLSLRRATQQGAETGSRKHHFYPRSPCGERLGFSGAFGASDKISIHALLAESDCCQYVHIRAPL